MTDTCFDQIWISISNLYLDYNIQMSLQIWISISSVFNMYLISIHIKQIWISYSMKLQIWISISSVFKFRYTKIGQK